MTDQASEATQARTREGGSASDSARGKDGDLANLNHKTAQRQKALLLGIAVIAFGGFSWFVLGSDERKPRPSDEQAQTIDTGSVVNRNQADAAFRHRTSNQMADVQRNQKALAESQYPREEAETEIAALKAENQAMRSNGQAAIDAITAENAALKGQIETRTVVPPSSPPPPAYGPQGGSYDARSRAAAPAAAGSANGQPGLPDAAPAQGEVKLMSFTPDKAVAGGMKLARPEAPPLVVEDSPDYLPPNSYARARVIVGVDASASVTSQSDPLPVVLRITGPARSVLQNGKVLTTRIQGCVVNGAARGDLSSEKVYVKLARMTCDQPGGRVAVSEVKGFISFAGKSGVRGRVVSREGSLVTQALLAGIVGGFGRGFSANSNSIFSSVRSNADGTRSQLSAGDILGGGLGQGAADAADTVSKYLIERAEQYQPVVEMPTGIDVEIVFLDGVYVRNCQ